MRSSLRPWSGLPGVLLCGLLGLSLTLPAETQETARNGGDFSSNSQPGTVPSGALIVKGAWFSASDSVTPVPEGGVVANGHYNNSYFALDYPVSTGWGQHYEGPPPSDTGYYVLAQLAPTDTSKGKSRAMLLIAAQDLFFTRTAATSALELVNYTRATLSADYKVEQPPVELRISGRSFVRFGYMSPAAGLHWSVLATQNRCHVVEFIFTSRDARLIDSLIRSMGELRWSARTDNIPVCIKEYARNENILQRVDPMFSERRYNPIPVRVIIDREGKVKHVHFLSAFPEQAKAIMDALMQWRFKPYLSEGQAVEVETGIMFGRAPR